MAESARHGPGRIGYRRCLAGSLALVFSGASQIFMAVSANETQLKPVREEAASGTPFLDLMGSSRGPNGSAEAVAGSFCGLRRVIRKRATSGMLSGKPELLLGVQPARRVSSDGAAAALARLGQCAAWSASSWGSECIALPMMRKPQSAQVDSIRRVFDLSTIRRSNGCGADGLTWLSRRYRDYSVVCC